jgi:tryptophan synthase beta chain
MKDKIEGTHNPRIIAVEPSACPSLNEGKFKYDYGDTGKMTPLLKMYTLGYDFIPPAIHSGGLRYHGCSPIISELVAEGLMEAITFHQQEVFEAGVLFARTEGFAPAPESSHAIKCAAQEALKCKDTGEEKTILFNLSGHGHFDMASYDKYFSGELTNE